MVTGRVRMRRRVLPRLSDAPKPLSDGRDRADHPRQAVLVVLFLESTWPALPRQPVRPASWLGQEAHPQMRMSACACTAIGGGGRGSRISAIASRVRPRRRSRARRRAPARASRPGRRVRADERAGQHVDGGGQRRPRANARRPAEANGTRTARSARRFVRKTEPASDLSLLGGGSR